MVLSPTAHLEFDIVPSKTRLKKKNKKQGKVGFSD